MAELFDRVCALKQNVSRNIVKQPHTVFSDLIDNEKNANAIAMNAIHRVMNLNHESNRDFHYTTAIGYPFEPDHFMSSRYSDGSFPIWYGSLDRETTIYETVYTMIKSERQRENFQQQERIYRERTIYNVFCNGILIDLTEKLMHYPELISEDYTFTQHIGKTLNQQGYPGLLVKSARFATGINVNVFKSEILLEAQLQSHLTYCLYPSLKKVEVSEHRKIINEISW